MAENSTNKTGKPRDPKEWTHNDSLMLRLEGQKIQNPLIYNKIQYPSHEWDNIPPVVPRFIIQLEKYMTGITEFLSLEAKKEQVASLRAFTEVEVSEIDTRLKEAANKRQEIQQKLSGEIKGVDDFARKLEAAQNQYRDSLLYTKTCTVMAPSEEAGLIEVYKNYILEERKPEQMGDQPPPQSAMENYRQARKEAVLVPRLVSVAGYQELFDLAIQDSVLRRRQDTTDEEIVKLKEEIANLKAKDEDLQENIEALEFDQNDQRRRCLEEQTMQNTSFISQFKDAFKQITSGREVSKQLNANLKATKDEVEKTEGDFLRFKEDFQKFRSEVFNTVRGTKEDLQEQITQSDKFFGELTTQLTEEIKDVRNLATHEMRKQEKELVNRFSGQFEEVNHFVKESVDFLKKEAASLQERFVVNSKKIKTVCSTYFQRYETDLDELKIKINNLQDKYKDWQRILIEPQAINEARLFSLESRVVEEENMRIKEYEYVRDLFKKLLYCLEQVNMFQMDKKGMTSPQTNLNLSSDPSHPTVEKLPNLLVSGPEAARKSMKDGEMTTTFNKSIEFMMMKRLNFLMNSLETHDPHETTLRLRDNAAKARDERILELWHKDQSMPKTQELISKMHAEKSKQMRNDWSDGEADDGESLIENDMKSLTSGANLGRPSQNPLQQNSLFSSITANQHNNVSMSISGGNSIQFPRGDDSRLKQISKGTHGVDEDGTIGGSTQYPYQYESVHSNRQDRSQGFRSTKESPMHLRQKTTIDRINENLKKKKFTTNVDEEADKIRLRNEEYKVKKNNSSVEPFWNDFNQTMSSIMAEKEKPVRGRRGPSHPARNMSNAATMNLTMQGFRKAVDHRKTDLKSGVPASHRDRPNGKLQPINHLKAGKIETTHYAKPEVQSELGFREEDGENVSIAHEAESILTETQDQHDLTVVPERNTATAPE